MVKKRCSLKGLNLPGIYSKEQQKRRAIYSAHLIWGKRYPALRAAFFDTHFLRTRVIPLFVESPDANPVLDPALLAQLWVDQFPDSAQRRHQLVAQLTPAVADLLRFIEAEQRYFASETLRRQAKLRRFWRQLPLRGVVRTISTLADRLTRRRARTAPDCGASR